METRELDFSSLITETAQQSLLLRTHQQIGFGHLCYSIPGARPWGCRAETRVLSLVQSTQHLTCHPAPAPTTSSRLHHFFPPHVSQDLLDFFSSPFPCLYVPFSPCASTSDVGTCAHQAWARLYWATRDSISYGFCGENLIRAVTQLELCYISDRA